MKKNEGIGKNAAYKAYQSSFDLEQITSQAHCELRGYHAYNRSADFKRSDSRDLHSNKVRSDVLFKKHTCVRTF